MTFAAPSRSASRLGRGHAIVLLLVVQPLCGLGYQIATEKLALTLIDHPYGLAWLISVIESPWAWVMLACDVAGLASWIAVLSRFPLGVAFSLTSISYVLIMGAAWLVFREPLNGMQVVGGVIILAGIWLLAQGRDREEMDGEGLARRSRDQKHAGPFTATVSASEEGQSVTRS